MFCVQKLKLHHEQAPVPGTIAMNVSAKRLVIAMAVYGVLFLIALLTLKDERVLKAAALALTLFAAKTYFAYRSQK